MGRKNKEGGLHKTERASSLAPISERGKKTIAIGCASVILGFIALSRADPLGRDWPARLCPFLILGGYALVAFGIFLPESRQR